MDCEVCGAKLAEDAAVCPECGAELLIKAAPPVPRKQRKTANAPARNTIAVPSWVITHAVAVAIGLLLGAVFFGGPSEQVSRPPASMSGAAMPAGHPTTGVTTKAPPLTEEQMRKGLPPGHPAMGSAMPGTADDATTESAPTTEGSERP